MGVYPFRKKKSIAENGWTEKKEEEKKHRKIGKRSWFDKKRKEWMQKGLDKKNERGYNNIITLQKYSRCFLLVYLLEK